MNVAVAREVEAEETWKQDFPSLDQEQIRTFAQNIGDMNPIHHDPIAAEKIGLDDIIAPGVMLTGFISSAIAKRLPNAMVRHVDLRFSRPLYPDTPTSVHCAITSARHGIAEISVKVRTRTRTILKGNCTVLLPF